MFPHDAKLFGSASNNGQMISEIEPKGRCAENLHRNDQLSSPAA